MRAVQQALTEARGKAGKLQEQNRQLRDSHSAAKSKGTADQRAMLTLQRILEERQLEYAGLRKQYALVEGAIRGTSYVKEIQECISKAATEQDYEKSVSEDLELVGQLDSAKRAALGDRTERDLLKRENAEL